MAEITASAVKSLRERTGAGMMDCKRALEETGGDEERAIDLLRQRGAAKAAKRAGRETSEGAVQIALGEDGRSAALVEVATETDFVSRSEDFVTFAASLAEAVRTGSLPEGSVAGEEEVLEATPASMEEELDALRRRVGENVRIRRAVRWDAAEDATIASYLHFGNRIGVLVEVAGAEEREDLGRDVAMHVAAASPLAVSAEDIPEEVRERERSILVEQARAEGKPDHIAEKIVEGRMRKFYEQSALLQQPYVRDPDRRVEELLADGTRVLRFVRFEAGE